MPAAIPEPEREHLRRYIQAKVQRMLSRGDVARTASFPEFLAAVGRAVVQDVSSDLRVVLADMGIQVADRGASMLGALAKSFLSGATRR